MKLCLVSMSLVAVFGMLSPLMAQTAQPHGPGRGNPAGTPPATREAAPGVPAPRQLNEADRKFLKAATMGGAAEVELGQLAERMSTNTDVKQFAQPMVREHQEANKRLVTLARNAGLPQMQGLDPDRKAIYDRLAKLQGAAFDRAYIDSQIVDHQVMAQLLEYEIGSGQDTELKGLATDLLRQFSDISKQPMRCSAGWPRLVPSSPLTALLCRDSQAAVVDQEMAGIHRLRQTGLYSAR